MIESALLAFWTLFAVIGPLETSALFAAITPSNTAEERRRMSIRGILIAGLLIYFFAFFGNAVLTQLGVSLAALRTGGGILLLLMAIDMVFARNSGGISTTDEEEKEAVKKQDVSVFPLATPLIAGPGAIGAIVLLMADAGGEWQNIVGVCGALFLVLLLTLICLLLATQLQKLLGVTGMQVVERTVGVLLAAMAVQFIFDGVAASPLIGN